MRLLRRTLRIRPLLGRRVVVTMFDPIPLFRRLFPSSRASNIVGRFGGGTRREYCCNLCQCLVDTDSASWPETAHAARAISKHVALHQSRWETDRIAEILSWEGPRGEKATRADIDRLVLETVVAA